MSDSLEKFITMQVAELGMDKVYSELVDLRKRVDATEQRIAELEKRLDEHASQAYDLIGQVNWLKSRVGNKDDLIQRLQTKVENLDSRLDLNVTARKELKMVQHKLADLDNRTRGDIRYGGVLSTPEITAKEFSKQLNPQPFDPAAFPNVGDWVKCRDGWSDRKSTFYFEGERKASWVGESCNFKLEGDRGLPNRTWGSCYRRLDPASKDKPHNPTCLCKDCHEDKQPTPLPPFVSEEIVGIQNMWKMFEDYKLDKQRIRMLVDWLNNKGAKISRQELLRLAGCDNV